VASSVFARQMTFKADSDGHRRLDVMAAILQTA
jgi:hypothetical protein